MHALLLLLGDILAARLLVSVLGRAREVETVRLETRFG
jgi:hypothetical protein